MKRALVTGSDGELGKELCLQLEAKGYEVVGSTNKQCALGSWMFVGKFSVVINNYGINFLSKIGEAHIGREIMQNNVVLPYDIVSALVRNDNGPAQVINVSSITHRVPQRCSALYCASKAALVQMTRVMARELAPKGWQINCYCPGKILDTEMTRKTDKQVLELRGWDKDYADKYALSNVPVGRFMTKSEAAHNCLAILNFTNYVNGAIIEASGGQ